MVFIYVYYILYLKGIICAFHVEKYFFLLLFLKKKNIDKEEKIKCSFLNSIKLDVGHSKHFLGSIQNL